MASRSVTARWLLALTLVITGTCLRAAAKAESAAVLKVDETTEIDSIGNATVHSTVTAPTVVYTAMKTNTPNVALMLRKFGVGRGWEVLENADAKFNDVKNRVEITYNVRGFARVEQGNRWMVPVDKDASLELLESHDRSAIFQGTINSSGIIVNLIERVVLPEGGSHLKTNAQCSSFCYDFAPKVTDGSRTDTTFELEAKDTIMGCLAKCYSNEAFDVRAAANGPALAVLDRGALPSFGVVSEGVHVNGLVRRTDGLHVWIARRARTKQLDPGKLDHMVAGGIPAGLSPAQTLVKEAAEEAAVPEALAAGARRVGMVQYAMERPEGLRRDRLYCYDLALPEDFVPRAADGEVEFFELWPVARAVDAVRETDDFKFNVNLVMIDLFLRERLIGGPVAEVLRTALDDGRA